MKDIEMMTMELQQIFRPEWTCGRYNSEKQVAIMYNLIEGQVYFFEDISAKVIGEFLKYRRNTEIHILECLSPMGIPLDEIKSFIELLCSLHLLCPVYPSKEYIKAYRTQIIEMRKNNTNFSHASNNDENMNTAERAYFDVVSDDFTITNVMFELTYNCSERCLHCYNPGATRNDNEISFRHKRNELTLEDYKHIIDELDERGVVKVCLSGGDPFSKDVVWKVIDYLYKKEIAIDIFTNGLRLLGEEERLANYYPRLVGLSLYSGIPEDHDRITNIRGSQETTIKVMERLSDFVVPMNLKCCIMRPNVKSYYTVKNIAKRIGAIPQFELNITDSLDGDKCASRYLRLTPDMMEIVLQDEDIIKSLSLYEIASKEKVVELGDKICGAGENSFCITPEGNVQPCCAFPLILGNLKEYTLLELLEKSQNLKWWRRQTFKDFVECYTHEYCVYCRMCPGNNYVANKTPLKPSENNCAIAKIKYVLSQKLKDGYDPLNGNTLENRLQEIELQERILHREYN